MVNLINAVGIIIIYDSRALILIFCQSGEFSPNMVTLTMANVILSDEFDVRKFHMQVLNCIGPLDFLEECVLMEEKLWSQNDTNISLLDDKD